MNDLSIFDRRDDGETGDLDVDQLRAALAGQAPPSAPPPTGLPGQAPATPQRPAGPMDIITVPPRPEDPRTSPDGGVRRTRHRWSVVAAIVVLVVIVAALAAGFVVWRSHADTVADYSGTGGDEVIVRIQRGDSTDNIAQTLAQAGVVASVEAFQRQAAQDADVQALQPGYYRVRKDASAQAAADALVDPTNHVGQVRLIPGRQLADVTAASTDPNVAPTVVPGYISEITKAACVPVNGQADCFTADQLWQVARTADPATLGVVEWGIEAVRSSPEPDRRLEGMILPGDFDIPPGSSPEQALRAVVSASAAIWNTSDVTAAASRLGVSPYQLAIVASIVEREGITADMPKVARVIYNRLALPMKLQMDSTVNYALNRAAIATSNDDRANPSPWNTYSSDGLPPTPISSPGKNAVAAAAQPATGAWMYFVKIDQDGSSCFSDTIEQHTACVDQARANGIFG